VAGAREERKKGQALLDRPTLSPSPQPSFCTAGPTAFTPPPPSSLSHDAWLEWEERALRPAAVGGGSADELAAALATLGAAVSAAPAAHLSGGPEPALADVAVYFTLVGHEEVTETERGDGNEGGRARARA